MRYFFSRTAFPLFLIIACPICSLIIWEINAHYSGSITSFIYLQKASGLWTTLYQMWQPVFLGNVVAWKIIAIFAAFQLLLMKIVPGKIASGPITPQGNVPKYKDNGLTCFLITTLLFLTLSKVFNLFPISIVYDNFAAIIGALNLFSLFFCLFLYFKGRFFPNSTDSGGSNNFIFDYYWGMELHPRVWGWDIKQFTNCRFGMMSWPIIILSFAGKQADIYGLSTSMVTAVIIMMAYIAKFFIWERGYLSSMDIMHDRAGFMICWGCLVWVPVVYTSPILYLVHHPIALSKPVACLISILGLFFVIVNFLTDQQRQMFREKNGQCKIFGKEPVTIEATYETENKEQKKTYLLASGWWGMSRHFRYLTEILAALFWTLPAGLSSILPYFYVTYLTILLLQRSYRIEVRCSKKYGAAWDEYKKLVPAYLFPSLRKKELQKQPQ